MLERFRYFWKPAFLAALAAQLTQTLMMGTWLVFGSRYVMVRMPHAVNYAFMLGLVIIGAAASYVTRRRGAPRGVAIAAGFIPLLFAFMPSFLAGLAALGRQPLSVLTTVWLPILITLLLAILLSHVPIKRQPEP